MKLEAAFLADAALFAQDGTFMVWRGGVDRTVAAHFPAQVKYALVVRLEAGPDEVAGQLHTLTLDLTYEGERIGPTMHIPVAVQENPALKRYHMNILTNVVIEVQHPGEGSIHARIADVALPLIYFEVVEGTPGISILPPPQS